MKLIQIKNKIIGENGPCFVIAEAGMNHNGKLDLAKKLIDVAKEAEVDAVKFQTSKSEDVMTEQAEMPEYQKENLGATTSQLEMEKEIELEDSCFEELKRYCDEKGIMFLSTPHSPQAIDVLEPLVPAFKVGSGDINNFPFLEKLAKKGKPIILSTGMSNLEEVGEAVKAIKEAGNEEIILLHCLTDYPADIGKVNLRAILTLRNTFKLLVGYSDHTLGITAPIAAVALGACVIEKHFTLDRNLPGPDHKASLEPEELKEMIKEIRNTEKAMGDGIKRPTEEEEEIKKVARKSIVAQNNIAKGEIIRQEMLAIKRPASGLASKELPKVIGKKAKRDIEKDELITLDILE